jgi:hypothetical protein
MCRTIFAPPGRADQPVRLSAPAPISSGNRAARYLIRFSFRFQATEVSELRCPSGSMD